MAESGEGDRWQNTGKDSREVGMQSGPSMALAQAAAAVDPGDGSTVGVEPGRFEVSHQAVQLIQMHGCGIGLVAYRWPLRSFPGSGSLQNSQDRGSFWLPSTSQPTREDGV